MNIPITRGEVFMQNPQTMQNESFLMCTDYAVKELEADYTELVNSNTRIVHEAMIDRENFNDINGQYSKQSIYVRQIEQQNKELEKAIELKGDAFNTLTDLYRELEKERDELKAALNSVIINRYSSGMDVAYIFDYAIKLLKNKDGEK